MNGTPTTPSRRRCCRACPGYPICLPQAQGPQIPGHGASALPGLPPLHEHLPEAALPRLSGLPNLPPSGTGPANPGSRRKRLTRATQSASLRHRARKSRVTAQAPYPGYRPADGWQPVAPVSAAQPGRLAAGDYRLLCRNCLTRSESGLLKNFSGGAFSINNPFSRNTTSSDTWRAKSISWVTTTMV